MLSKEQAQMGLYAMKGLLSEADAEEQAQVTSAHAAIEAVMDAYGDAAKLALTMVLMELAAKGEFL